MDPATAGGGWLAIAGQAVVLLSLIALVAGTMLTAARPVTQAEDAVEGNAASSPARHEPSSATFVSGPPGGLLILLVPPGTGLPASLPADYAPLLSTGGQLDLSIVESASPAETAAFLQAFTDAESVCGAIACRATWVVDLAAPR